MRGHLNSALFSYLQAQKRRKKSCIDYAYQKRAANSSISCEMDSSGSKQGFTFERSTSGLQDAFPLTRLTQRSEGCVHVQHVGYSPKMINCPQ